MSARCLPVDHADACLVGRVWVEDAVPGPRVVTVREGAVYDLSRLAPTMSDLLDIDDVAARARSYQGERICALEDATLLAPCDLQAIKAAGVTFADSMMERVIEERAKGDPATAAGLRDALKAKIGAELSSVRPGSQEAARAKEALIAAGLWSQYLEVGIGPDAEIFTKAQPMSAVGAGALIGIHPKSQWNNPEPEIVLACSSNGAIVGAALGNDVNLRDFEGRSALLLSKAKDNNASCAIGPFIRLFDHNFGLDDVRKAIIDLSIEGDDGFCLRGESTMTRISRDPAELVRQALNEEHQYPDGMMLFLGTLFSPTQDRDEYGRGFTHKLGDRVCISSPRLGVLENVVTHADLAPPWRFGARALMRSLASRGLF